MNADGREADIESVAVGCGVVAGTSIGVAIGESAGGPVVYLHLCPPPGQHPVSVTFAPAVAEAFAAAVVPVLGGPQWLADAVLQASRLIGVGGECV